MWTPFDPYVERLASLKLFDSVGDVFELDCPCSIVRVTGWSKASRRWKMQSQIDAFFEAKQQFTECLGNAHQREFQDWNDVIFDAKELMEPLVADRIADAVRNGWIVGLPEEALLDLRRDVYYDFEFGAAEHAFSHLVPGMFYTTTTRIYKAGHFPCGWDEVWPNGKL
jgi:hypothetical protein